MEYVKRNVPVYQRGNTIFDQFYLNEDVNVADAKPDARRVIHTDGVMKVEELKKVENYIRAVGKICYKILYAADEGEGKLALLEGKIPFEEMIYAEEEPEDQLFLKKTAVEIQAEMIHSRKLNLQVVGEITVCSEGRKEQEITLDIESKNHFYRKKEMQKFLRLVTAKRDTYRIRELLTVGGTKENVGTILWCEVESRKLDSRIEDGNILLQGELSVFCFYESLDGKMDWLEQMVPYQGKIACHGASDSMFHQIYTDLSDVNVDIRMDGDGEMRNLGIEATLEAHVTVYEEEEMEVLKDIYALDHKCILEKSKLQVEQVFMQNHSKCKLVEQLSLPEIKEDILQICHSSGKIQIENTEIVERGVQLDGVLHLNFLYVKADDAVPFDVWQGMVPFSWLLESNETSADMEWDINGIVEQLAVGLLGNDQIEVKAVLAFRSFLKKKNILQNIDQLELQELDAKEMEKAPGMIGYIVKDGDTLWELAKKYSTTEACIKEINHLDVAELKAGRKLLIFKENMSIL